VNQLVSGSFTSSSKQFQRFPTSQLEISLSSLDSEKELLIAPSSAKWNKSQGNDKYCYCNQ